MESKIILPSNLEEPQQMYIGFLARVYFFTQTILRVRRHYYGKLSEIVSEVSFTELLIVAGFSRSLFFCALTGEVFMFVRNA